MLEPEEFTRDRRSGIGDTTQMSSRCTTNFSPSWSSFLSCLQCAMLTTFALQNGMFHSLCVFQEAC